MTHWVCLNCGTGISLAGPYRSVLCPCTRAGVPMISLSADYIRRDDCGDYALRVVPTWGQGAKV